MKIRVRIFGKDFQIRMRTQIQKIYEFVFVLTHAHKKGNKGQSC